MNGIGGGITTTSEGVPRRLKYQAKEKDDKEERGAFYSHILVSKSNAYYY